MDKVYLNHFLEPDLELNTNQSASNFYFELSVRCNFRFLKIFERYHLGLAGFFLGFALVFLFFRPFRGLRFFGHDHFLQSHALAVHGKFCPVYVNIAQNPGNKLGRNLKQEQFNMIPIRFGVRQNFFNPGKTKRFVFKINNTRSFMSAICQSVLLFEISMFSCSIFIFRLRNIVFIFPTDRSCSGMRISAICLIFWIES